MTYIQNTNIKAADSPSIDAFARLRVSQLNSLIDLKQVDDNLSLFYDTVTNGTGAALYNANTSSTTLSVSANGDYAIRQTYQRFNYSTGKSQLCIFTFSGMDSTPNVVKRIGGFQTSTVAPYTANRDGIYLENDGTDLCVCVSNLGAANKISQANWNVDKLDGTGPSGLTLDPFRSNIFFYDYEWLGVGRIRAGFFINGIPYYVHYFNNANNLISGVYMKSPNQPVRYEIYSTGGSDTMEQICATVASEGAINTLGYEISLNNAINFQADTSGANYAVYGIRLKDTQLNSKVDVLRVSTNARSNDDFIWSLVLNPTVSNPNAFVDVANSSIQSFLGNGGTSGVGSIATGGLVLQSGLGLGNQGFTLDVESALSLGVAIDGTRDEIYLVIEPLSAGLDVDATLTIRQKI